MKFCVIGLGRFGYQVATGLAENGKDVLAIDSDESIVGSIKDQVTQAICVRVTTEAALRSIGVDEKDTVIVAMAESYAESILLTALLKKRLHVKTVIARAIDDIHAEVLELIGADRTILPEKEIGIRLADNLSSPFPELVRLSKNFAITPIDAPESFLGRSIQELDLTHEFKVTCIGIRQRDEILPPHPEYIITPGDELVCAGEAEALERVARE